MYPSRTHRLLRRQYRGSYADALAGLLKQFLELYGRPPELLLLMADVYQYEKRQPARAIPFLREYLRVRDDPAVGVRLRRLKGRSGRSLASRARRHDT
jgi:hypothetical protein